MTRPSVSRVAPAPPPEKAPAAKAPEPPADAPPAPPPSTVWRLTIIVWLTSFGFLFLYELLLAVLRLFSRKG